MSIPEQCDVVVIGGGPAGSIAATLLAQKGYEVVLLERERHPRYRVGESLIPHFWKYCDMVGVSEKIEADGFIQKAGGTTVWNGIVRQMAFKDFGYGRPALHVERDRFDQILLEHAASQGVQVHEEVAVIRAEVGDRPGVQYRRTGDDGVGEISCRYVIDATGQNAVIGKQLGIRYIDEQFRFMSIWGYFDDARYLALDGKAYSFDKLRETPPTTFVSSLDELGDWGWLWHIPLRQSTSVGIVVPSAQMQAAKGQGALEEYYRRTCAKLPYLNRLLEEAKFREGSLRVIRDYSYRTTQFAGSGFYLIGDAAAFVDPIFSVGIVLAMYSAYLAAWSIDRSLQTPASATRNQAIFSGQLKGRIEVSRSLALPRYGFGGNASEKARSVVHFESALEQELMYVVSTMTTRNENVFDMIERKDGRKIFSDRFKTLDEVVV